MSVTININGLTLCHKGSGGVSAATVPDVCKTPPIPTPIPYPNIAFSADLAKGTTTVEADGGNTCANYGSEFSKSTGDEPGVGGGVASGTFIKEATWITFSFDVKFEGKGACRLTDKMFHNHHNTVNMGGLFQIFLSLAGNVIKRACELLLEEIKKLIGEGQIDKVTGARGNLIRGLWERFKQQREGGSLGTMGAPNAPPLSTSRNGQNAWQNHNGEIQSQQKNLNKHLDEYDDKCGGGDPPPSNARKWAREPLPEPSEYTAPLWAPSTSPSTLARVGWGALGLGLGLAAVALAFVPFDGPVGEYAAGSGSAAAWGMAFAL